MKEKEEDQINRLVNELEEAIVDIVTSYKKKSK